MMLEAGMEIYGEEHFGKYLRKYTITRVTPKQAIIEICKTDGSLQYDIRFDRDIGDKQYFYAKGEISYTRTCYRPHSLLLQARYEHQLLLAKVGKTDLSKLSVVQLEAIAKIIEGVEE